MHAKFVRYLLQRQSLPQAHDRLRPHSGTWMTVENPQCPPLTVLALRRVGRLALHPATTAKMDNLFLRALSLRSAFIMVVEDDLTPLLEVLKSSTLRYCRHNEPCIRYSDDRDYKENGSTIQSSGISPQIAFGGTLTVQQPRVLILTRHRKSAGEPDGSLVSLTGFLRELAALAGQGGTHIPILELQFGDIETRTTVERIGKSEFLTVTALLPRSECPPYLSPKPAALLPTGVPQQAATILWDKEELRYIATRRVPVSDLPDERSVMDAILQTSDEAIGWFALLRQILSMR
jgi:hypothetical protein